MPVINVIKKDFEKLVRVRMSTIRERLPMLGIGWEGENEKEFSIEVFPNRPDMLSAEGLARAFLGFIGKETGLKKYKVEKRDYEVRVCKELKNVRPYAVFAVVKGLRFTDAFIQSFMQLQEKLHVSIGRKRSKAAIGICDLDKLKFPVNFRLESPKFKYVPLEGTYPMTLEEITKEHPKGIVYGDLIKGYKRYPILIDARGTVLSMPPIVNSEDAKVEEGTKNVFIDVTGWDLRTISKILNILVCALADRGGSIFSVKIEYDYETEFGKSFRTPKLEPEKMILDQKYVNNTLGLNLSKKEILANLEKMRFGGKVGKVIGVLIPAYRTDIMHKMDLVEDVGVAYGYENFEPEIPELATIGEESKLEVFSIQVRNLLVGLGFQEVLTYILSNKGNLFTKMNLKKKGIVEIENPKTKEYTVCRNWLIPGLLDVLSRNKHHEYPQRIFEVGDAFVLDRKSETGAKAIRKVAVAICHSKADFSEAKAILNSFIMNLGLDYSIVPKEHPSFISGRFGEVKGKIKGIIGEVTPQVLINFGLEHPVSVFELELR